MAIGTFSKNGFSVVASNALDLISGTQAAGAGMVSANIQSMANTLHADLGSVSTTLFRQTEKLAGISQEGFSKLGDTMSKGFSSLEAISGASLAVQAVGFAVVAKQLDSLGGDIRSMHNELAEQGELLIAIQSQVNAKLESLVHFASRTLQTQEKILETLVSSRTVEAQQFIRQGWDNLVNGYEDEAFSRFLKSLDFDNTVYLAHAELGRLYDKKGDLRQAEDHLRRATKFSTSAGPQVRAFACVQLAGFFERASRPRDAVAEIREALKVQGIDEISRAGWKVYLAELHVALGEIDEALRLVREAILSDSRIYVAVMASKAMEGAQPSLTKMLLALDLERRARALKNIEDCLPYLNQLGLLQFPGESGLRAECARAMEEIITARFQELEGLIERTAPLAPRVRALVRPQVQELLNSLFTKSNRLATDCRALAAEPPVAEPASENRLGRGIAAAGWIAGMAVGVGYLSDAVYGTTWLIAGIFFPVFGMALGALIRSNSSSSVAAHSILLGERRARWTAKFREIVAERSNLATAISKATSLVTSVNLDPGLASDAVTAFQNLTLPPLPTIPQWVSAGGDVAGAENAIP